jgi:hypothetical protein
MNNNVRKSITDFCEVATKAVEYLQMDSWAKWLEVLKDPEPVWQFQSFFGIQKVRQ